MKWLLSTITAAALLISPTALIYKMVNSSESYYEGIVWDDINWEREWENQYNVDRYNVKTVGFRFSPNIEFTDINYDPADRNGTLSFDMRFNFSLEGKEWFYKYWVEEMDYYISHEDEFKVHVGLYESEDKNPYDLNQDHSSESFTYNKYAMQDIDNDREIDSLDFMYALPTRKDIWLNGEYREDSDELWQVDSHPSPYFDKTYTWTPYDSDGNHMAEWEGIEGAVSVEQNPNNFDFRMNGELFKGYGEDASSIIDLHLENNPDKLEFTNLNSLFEIGGLESQNLYLFANIYMPVNQDSDYTSQWSSSTLSKYFIEGNTDNNLDVPMIVYNGFFVENMNIEEVDSNVSYKEYKIDTEINGVNNSSSQDQIDWANKFVVPYNVEVYDNSTNELITTSETFNTINGDNTFIVPTHSNQELRFEINQEKIDVPNEYYGNNPVHQEQVINSGILPTIGKIDSISNFDIQQKDETSAIATFNSKIDYEESIIDVEPYEVSIIDQSGETLATQTFNTNGQQIIELNNLIPGQEYLLSLATTNDSINIESSDPISFSIPKENNHWLFIMIGIIIAIILILLIVVAIMFSKKKNK